MRWFSATLFWAFCGIAVCFWGNAHALTPVGTTIPNSASVSFSASGTSKVIPSNTVLATIIQFSKVAASTPLDGTILPGQTVTRTFTITNQGNGNDTFNLQVASSQGLIEQFRGADGVTPLTDSNGDGQVDSGSMLPGATLTVTLVMSAPLDVATGVIDNSLITATSIVTPTVTANVTTATTISDPHLWSPLIKSVTPAGQVTPSTLLSYSVTFGHTGSVPATNVVISDKLDPHLIYQAGSAKLPANLAGATVSYDPATRTISWRLPSVPPGYAGSLGFIAQVHPDTLSDTIIPNNIAIVSEQNPRAQLSNTVSSPIVEQPLQVLIQADKPEVELGGFMGFTVTVENTSRTLTAKQVTLVDQLPQGFRYVKGTSSVDKVVAKGEGGTDKTAVTDLLSGSTSSWLVGDLPPKGRRVLTYRTIVSINAPMGDAFNTVSAKGTTPAGYSLLSGVAVAKVKVIEGVLNSRATILGRVFVDVNRDLMPDGDEPGVRGVRLYLEDGSYVITDGEGKFSFAGVEAGDHVLKIDRTTIPPLLEPEVLDSTFAGDANSRFVSLPFGGMGRGDFGLVLKKNVPVQETLPAPDTRKVRELSFGTEINQAPEPLEKRILTMPDSPEILSPESGSMSRRTWTDIVVRMPDGASFSVSVNKHLLSHKQIGKTIVEKSRNIRICQFVGIPLDQGVNRIVLEVTHAGGMTEVKEIVVTVAGDPVKILLTPDKLDLPANGTSTAQFTVSLFDKWDRPVSGEYQVTILTEKGEVLEKNSDTAHPGHHVRVQDGKGIFTLRSGHKSGPDKLRVIAGTDLGAEAELYFTPVAREWIVAGIGSLVAGYASNSGNPSGLDARGKREDGLYEDGRFAFFAKGAVADDYLVTAAYDTDNKKRSELFQRTAPDKYYPIYGDSSEKGYDAESQTKKYVKVEKGRSSLMYGDFKTDLSQNEFTRYDRSFNGAKADIDTKHATLRAFGSSTNHAVNRDELAGNGTSGYYFLSKKPIIENTEKIRIEVRDRFHTQQVISSKEKQPFSDYSFDYLTGAILFREPVPSLDANLNPVTIVVMYETEHAGDDHGIYGGRGAIRTLLGSELGATAIVEEKGVANDTLYGVDGKLILNEKSVLKVEAAQSSTIEKGTGKAWKTELATQIEKARLEAYFRHVDSTFRNPSMSGNETGTEKYGVKGSYRLLEPTLLLAESYYQSDLIAGTKLLSNSAGVSHKLGDYTVDSGVKYLQSREDSGKDRSSPMLYAGVGGKLTDKLEVSLLREQALTSETVKDNPTRSVAKANYRVTERTSAFVTQELQEGGDNRKNSTIAGISTKLNDRMMITTSYQGTTGSERSSKAGTELASKWDLSKDLMVTSKTGYQMENSMTGDRGQALLGVDSSWRATKNLKVGLRAERVQLVSGTNDPAGVNTALALSSEYLAREDVKIGGRYELRIAPNETSYLYGLGGAWKMTREFSLLGKASYWISDKNIGSDKLFDGEVGGAYRPMGRNSLYLLGMLRFKLDSKGSVLNYGDTKDLIGSLEMSRKVSQRLTTRYKYAGKLSWYEGAGISSRAYTDMFLAGLIYDITKKWDLGVDLKLMNQYETGMSSLGIVPKLSYLVQKNVKLAVGYNLARLDDRDLTGESYQAQGPFVELKFKFDEVTVEELYRKVSGTSRVEVSAEAPKAAPAAIPTVTVILKAMFSEDPVELYGSARSMKFMVNDREVVLPTGDVTVRSESADEVIDIKGSELSKPLEFRVEVADVPKISSWRLAISSLDGVPLRVLNGEGNPGSLVSWDGRIESGALLKGGDIYQYQLEVGYQDGSRVTSPLRRFGLNRTSLISVSFSGGAFITDSAVLSRKARNVLSETAALLRKYTEEKVIIEGHTDSVGSEKYNMDLSRRRSQSAADYLLSEKIAAERIVTRWYGKTRPIASNQHEEGREMNRRVDVKGEFRDLKRPEILDQSRTAPFVRINKIAQPLDQTGRFFSKLADRSERVEIEMGDESGRSVSKSLELPNLLLLEPAGGTTRVIHQFPDYADPKKPPELRLAYTFVGSATKNSKLTLDGKEIPVDPQGKFSLVLELREGENVFWLHVVTPDGYGKYVKMTSSVVRENSAAPLNYQAGPGRLIPVAGSGASNSLAELPEAPALPLPSNTQPGKLRQAYTLGFGEYRQLSALEAAKSKLTAAGLHPEVLQGERTEALFRLQVAAFDNPHAARSMVEKLKGVAAAGFILANGQGRFVVYAGSFRNRSMAENEQSRLVTQGITAQLTTETISVPTYQLVAGSYDTLRLAVLEAAKLERLGVNPLVVDAAR